MRKQLARLKKSVYINGLRIVDNILGKDYSIRYHYTANGYHTSFFTFSKEKIAFVHVPKTGGTSFYKMLSQNKNHDFINIDIHRPVSVHCPPADFKYITILRHPIDRVWSYYQMVLRNSPEYPYKKFAVKGLECFLKNCWAASDMTCQYYAGKVYKKVNQQVYNKALSNLNDFQTSILFDNFAEELSTFFKENNIPFKEILHERNAIYTAPTAAEKKLIETYNQYDIALFEAWKAKRENQHK
ncbi:MAG: hypothetical protein ACI94Y_004523 [Maribacter sp.]|jgi:hypothetical protein